MRRMGPSTWLATHNGPLGVSLHPILCWVRHPRGTHSPPGSACTPRDHTNYLLRRELLSACSKTRHAHPLQHRSTPPLNSLPTQV